MNCIGDTTRTNIIYLGKTGLIENAAGDDKQSKRGLHIWIRAGHAILQENKSAVLDLLDSLACPSELIIIIM